MFENKSLRVTLIGKDALIDSESQIKALEYLEMRSVNWKNKVNLVIKKPIGFKEMIKYLADFKRKKLVILPNIVDNSGFLFLQLLRTGIPVISSALDCFLEMTQQVDHEIFFKPNDKLDLSLKLVQSLKRGILIARPSNSAANIGHQWRQLLNEMQNFPSLPEPNFETLIKNYRESSTPLVTVVLVHHDRHNYLKQVIESLEKQSFSNFELILVDDGSNDPESIRLLSDFSWSWWQERPWKVLREPNRYLGAARNTGGL